MEEIKKEKQFAIDLLNKYKHMNQGMPFSNILSKNGALLCLNELIALSRLDGIYSLKYIFYTKARKCLKKL